MRALRRGVIESGKEIAELHHDVAACIGFDVEKALDAIDLIGGQADAADRVARLVLVAAHQLAGDFVEADFVEFVENAKDVSPLNVVYRGKIEEQIEHCPAGEADEIAADVERGQRVAHPGNDLGVGDL